MRASWSRENGEAIRTILAARLTELSLVANAAYPETSACSLEEQRRLDRLEKRVIHVFEGGIVSEDIRPELKIIGR